MSTERTQTAAWGITVGETAAAIEWRDRHSAHVQRLVAGEDDGRAAYPPSGSDCRHPELWRAPHWRWLETVSND